MWIQCSKLFFFLLDLVYYLWSYAYDELTFSMSCSCGVDFLCYCICWTTIILYVIFSMNTHVPCPRNCKMLGRIDYPRMPKLKYVVVLFSHVCVNRFLILGRLSLSPTNISSFQFILSILIIFHPNNRLSMLLYFTTPS